MSVTVDLGPVQETLLIPLLGRAEEARKPDGLLRDRKAVEIVDALDYDFSKWAGKPSMMGAILRARMFDAHVRRFLDQHPDGTVVEIGAGLNTRYERLDNGRATWFEIDLPDSMALRRQFFADTERRSMHAASVLETGWLDALADLPAPRCFVSEAVIIYLDAPEVERALRQIGQRYPGSWLVMDTICTQMVDAQAQHDAMKHLSRASWMRWRCDDPASLGSWGLDLEVSESFMDMPEEMKAKVPFVYRFGMRWLPWLMRRRIDGYRINRFRFVG